MEAWSQELEAARRRLAGVAVRTSLVESPVINSLLGLRVLLKLECQQRTGSFKFRGAYNKVASLDVESRARGVAATSSGNHAQALAAAGKLHDAPVTIGMPIDSPPFKIERTRGFGAQIVHYDRYRDDEIAFGETLALDRGATLVHPFDDPQVIAGQGTAGLELFEQARALGADVDAILSPCSGGGLTAGLALAAATASARTRICCVEPEGYDDTARSLKAGERLANPMSEGRSTLCDALMVAKPGVLTFDINRRHVAETVVVGDGPVRNAMRLLATELRVIAEPAGAITLAALLEGFRPADARCVVVLVSGGNIALEPFAELCAK